MQLSELERKVFTEKLKELEEVEEELVRQLRKIGGFMFFIKELLRDDGGELKRKVTDVLLESTNNE